MKERDLVGWMWADACELIAQAERLHRQFFRVGAPRERLPTWEPPVDVFETDGEVLLCVALPGVAAEHIEVLLEEGVVTIAGVRVMPRECRTALIHRLEIPNGRFERRIRLPAPSMTLAHSRFDNGCLALTLRKR